MTNTATLQAPTSAPAVVESLLAVAEYELDTYGEAGLEVALDALEMARSRSLHPAWSKRLDTITATTESAVQVAQLSARSELAELNRRARSLAHGRDELIVDMSRCITRIAETGGEILAGKAAQALAGNAAAVQLWQARKPFDPLAVVLLELLARLTETAAAVTELAELTACAVAFYVVPAPAPCSANEPPRILLAGSVERSAP